MYQSTVIDLTWFFTQAESQAAGIQSSFGTLASVAQSGGVHIPPDMDMAERRLDESQRYRRIARRLTSVRPLYLQEILHLAYEPRRFAPEVEATFRELAGLASHTDGARTAFIEDSKRRKVTDKSINTWLLGVVHRANNGSQSDTALIRKIKREATAMLETAHKAYESGERIAARLDGDSVRPALDSGNRGRR